MSKTYLKGKHRDIREKLANKLLDGSITYEEKELIAMYLTTDNVIESALKVVASKLWKGDTLTELEKSLLALLFPKRGRGRREGTDEFNLMLSTWFNMIRPDCLTDTEARKRLCKELNEAGIYEAIDPDTLRKKIDAGKKAMQKQSINQIAGSINNIHGKEIIQRAIVEIK